MAASTFEPGAAGEALARRAIVAYGLDVGARLELVKVRENIVYRVTDSSGSYALRLHRRGYRSESEILSEVEYVRALRERGFVVPEMLPTPGGHLTLPLADDHGSGFVVDLQRWVDATEPLGGIEEAFDGTSPLSPETFFRLGALAAGLHNATEAIGRPKGFDRQAWDAQGLVGEAAVWGDPLSLSSLGAHERRVLTSAVARLRTLLEELGTASRNYGVVHADFTPENVLSDGVHLTLIDFDDFGEGWHLFDLATMLFWYQPHPRYADFRKAAVEGYRQARDLDDAQLELLPAFLCARGLTYLGWAASRPGNDTSEFIAAEVLPLVVRLADGL
ncbi:phosphotransferase enzyme family protein [Streptomyces acidicola]|uniref:phosphotransferase enzyme family protein n=1 Tax=Streptomyces acidicola TaxID=2596892 RepID=UPI0037FEB0FB